MVEPIGVNFWVNSVMRRADRDAYSWSIVKGYVSRKPVFPSHLSPLFDLTTSNSKLLFNATFSLNFVHKFYKLLVRCNQKSNLAQTRLSLNI